MTAKTIASVSSHGKYFVKAAVRIELFYCFNTRLNSTARLRRKFQNNSECTVEPQRVLPWRPANFDGEGVFTNCDTTQYFTHGARPYFTPKYDGIGTRKYSEKRNVLLQVLHIAKKRITTYCVTMTA